MRLERHVGGLGRGRKLHYLEARGWRAVDGGWTCARHTAAPLRLEKALHHQLTEDLTAGLAAWGLKVVATSPRGYATLEDPADESRCSIPAALRRQSRRLHRNTGDLGYSLFLASMLGPAEA